MREMRSGFFFLRIDLDISRVVRLICSDHGSARLYMSAYFFSQVMIGSHRTSRAPYGSVSGGDTSRVLGLDFSSKNLSPIKSVSKKSPLARSKVASVRNRSRESRLESERSGVSPVHGSIVSMIAFVERIAWRSDTGKDPVISSGEGSPENRSNEMISS